MTQLSCFKAYDIRGRLPDELNDDIAYRIGRAYGQYFKPTSVVVGGDTRLSTDLLKSALSNGLQDSGVNVLDLGLAGTEEMYFATFHLGVDGGIEVTASHNPMDYNGMKLVTSGARPVCGAGLQSIKKLAEENCFNDALNGKVETGIKKGTYKSIDILDEYVNHILDYINIHDLKPLKLVVNAGNGAAGHVVDAIESQLQNHSVPIELIKIHHEPDGTFPHGVPNPLLPECRQDTVDAVLKHGADMGIAWDGDFDRCFLFDEKGRFIEGYYIVGLLGEAFLSQASGAKIIHDPRLTWNTIDQVIAAGGKPVLCKTGHAFIKERMRLEDAVYGGEMSAHHYFRDFAFCDSGMIPWLLVAALMSKKGKALSALVEERISLFPSSGEINSKLDDPERAIDRVLSRYQADALDVDYTDGISVDMGQWRFNLRLSNTEAVIRLNVESRGDRELMQSRTDELVALIRA